MCWEMDSLKDWYEKLGEQQEELHRQLDEFNEQFQRDISIRAKKLEEELEKAKASYYSSERSYRGLVVREDEKEYVRDRKGQGATYSGEIESQT